VAQLKFAAHKNLVADARTHGDQLTALGQNVLNLLGSDPDLLVYDVDVGPAISGKDSDTIARLKLLHASKGGWKVGLRTETQYMPPEYDILALSRFCAQVIPCCVMLWYDWDTVPVQPYGDEWTIKFDRWND